MPKLWATLALCLTGMFGVASLILLRSTDKATAQIPLILTLLFAWISWDTVREAIR